MKTKKNKTADINLQNPFTEKSNWKHIFICFFLTALIYAQTIFFGYTDFDDDILVKNNKE